MIGLISFLAPLILGQAPVVPATEVSLLFAGDAMQHKAQIQSAKQGETYDYSPCFADITHEIASADYAVVNLESPIGGQPYTGRISNRITKRRIRPFPYRQQSLSRPLYPRGYTHIAYTRLYRNRPYRNLRFKRLIRKILSVHNLYKRNTNRLSELHVRNEWIYATLSINCQLHRQRKNKKRHFSCQNVECRPYRCLPTLGR